MRIRLKPGSRTIQPGIRRNGIRNGLSNQAKIVEGEGI
jgi:hypothetical protein